MIDKNVTIYTYQNLFKHQNIKICAIEEGLSNYNLL